MNEVEKVLKLCKDNKIALSTVEKACGFSNGYIARLRKGFFPPDRKQKIIEFFGKDIFGDQPQEVKRDLSEGELIKIEYENADDMTKEMIKRLLAYSRRIKRNDPE